jgi:DNA (cytosine-5)-methyltransferase 1
MSLIIIRCSVDGARADEIMGRKTYRFASLFCGCGGFDLGFANAGFRCELALDIDPVAVDVHQKNLGARAQVGDISDRTRWAIFDELHGIDVVVAGPPCQGFSNAGKLDPKDHRNRLVTTAGEIISRVEPKVVVMENVCGALSGPRRLIWKELLRSLQQMSYSVSELRCAAETLGVPQRRMRYLLIAARNCLVADVQLPPRPMISLRDALADLSNATHHSPRLLDADSRIARIASHIGPGQKLSDVRNGNNSVHSWDIPEVFGKTNKSERILLEALLRRRRQRRIRSFGDGDPVSAQALRHFLGKPVADTLYSLVSKGYVRRSDKAYELSRTYNGKCRRLRWDQFSPTVDTHFGDPWYFLHPDEQRGLTPREAARIQGFPDWYSFDSSEKGQYRLIGNAVPPPVAQSIATFVKSLLS